jgi:hypothetical protein
MVENGLGALVTELLGWFSVDPLLACNVKNCLVFPCKGSLTSFLLTQKEEKDLSLFSVDLHVQRSPDL